ncbi:MAG: hypothetical protein WC378_09270 [Opitutaceae bacterium]|jgi:hypothetical protein
MSPQKHDRPTNDTEGTAVRKSESEFVKELRQELSQSQSKRADYIKLKLAFTTALLGAGAFIQTDKTVGNPMLLIVPLVCLIFDLYIFGEDFSVKRAGKFLSLSPYCPREERIWEEVVSKNRDPFSHYAGPASTITTNVAAFLGLYYCGDVRRHPLFIYWLIFTICMSILPFAYRYTKNVLLKRLPKDIDDTRLIVK